LPKYIVQTSDKTYSANVDTLSKRHTKITLEGRAIECTCDRSDEIAAWSITLDGSKTHARSRSMDSGRVEVWVGGLPFQFSVLSLGPEELANIGKVSEKPQSGEIRAIMPGRITSIMVKPGEEVSVGTPLLLLEAMKMQNEIVSPKSGKVTSIKVREGAIVKKDATLIEIT
jgi:biotin carboxyl carrier protein